MKFILILNVILGCTLASGFRTYRQSENNPGKQSPLPACLRGADIESNLPKTIKTCVASIIKSQEFRDSLNLSVCDFVKGSVSLGLSCFSREMARNVGCPPKVLEGIMGLGEISKIGTKYLDYMFCDGPNPFTPPNAPPQPPQ